MIQKINILILSEDTYSLIFAFKMYQLVKEKYNYLNQFKEQYKYKIHFYKLLK